MFSLNIAKWVYDIADCCYHDASYVVKKKKKNEKRSRKRRKLSHFVQVVYMYGRITENK